MANSFDFALDAILFIIQIFVLIYYCYYGSLRSYSTSTTATSFRTALSRWNIGELSSSKKTSCLGHGHVWDRLVFGTQSYREHHASLYPLCSLCLQKLFAVLHDRTRGVGLAGLFLSLLMLLPIISMSLHRTKHSRRFRIWFSDFTAEVAFFTFCSLLEPVPWLLTVEDASFCQSELKLSCKTVNSFSLISGLSSFPYECVKHLLCDYLNNVCFSSSTKLVRYRSRLL